MKHLALAIAGVLMFALVLPAFAQPFADVPTDHWAFDAIAELAAKGLVEGYPDGTFKGDRAMTRYEMAMVVARLLARIEAIKIPPATKVPPAEIGRADVTRLERLLNEFRAELAALGVRVTALEEELNALRGRFDNTRTTGDLRFRYNVFPVGSPNGGATGRQPDARLRSRLSFTGQVSPDVTTTVRLWAANNVGQTGQFDVRFGNSTVFNSVSFDYLYFDMRTPMLLPISWRIGRQPITFGGTPNWGFGVGLFMDEANLGFVSGVNDGITARLTLGPVGVNFVLARDVRQPTQGTACGNPPTSPTVPCAGGQPLEPNLDLLGIRGSFEIIPGWTLGASYYTERNALAIPSVHPAHGAIVPASTTRGTGWEVDFAGNILGGVGFYAEYATWNASGFGVGSVSAWRAGFNISLGQAFGLAALAPTLDVWYKNYGPLATAGSMPIYTYGCDEIGFSSADCWNMRGWGTNLNLTFSPTLSAAVTYETYTRISTGQGVNGLWGRVNFSLASRTTLSLQYFQQTVGGAQTNNFYRAQLTYSW